MQEEERVLLPKPKTEPMAPPINPSRSPVTTQITEASDGGGGGGDASIANPASFVILFCD